MGKRHCAVYQQLRILAKQATTYDGQVYSIKDETVCIAEVAFKNCLSIKEITIPNSVRNIGESAFESCANLMSVTIGNGFSAIELYTFAGCEKLQSVTFGASVASIGKKAFYNCKELDEIKHRGTENQWNAIAKGTDWDKYYLGSYGTMNAQINDTIIYDYTNE